MAVEADIDVDLLKSEIKKTYSSVSEEPGRDFIFPTGRAWAEDLGYPAELAQVPDGAAESFAGVANPWVLGRVERGERVLDLGPDKDAVFAEIYRVLRPGGRIQLADVTIQRPVSEEGRRNLDLWTG